MPTKTALFQTYRPKYIEQKLLFLLVLTMVGGYMNGYSYVTRGGSLVTMQSGNMARIGIAWFTKDTNLFVISLIPIVGCLIGCTIAYLARNVKGEQSPIYWQKFSLSAEILLFTAIGFIPADVCNHGVNCAIAIVAGFQLCNLKTYRGYAHTTTLASGNVRNLGHIFAEFLAKPSKKSAILLVEYLILFVSFTVGAILGCTISHALGAPAIWFCGAFLVILFAQMCTKRALTEERRYLHNHQGLRIWNQKKDDEQ